MSISPPRLLIAPNIHTNDLAYSRRLSVIIPVFRAATNAEACLEALGSSISHSDEIILVVDGAGHGSLTWEDGVRVLTLGRRMGPAGARNAGSKLSTNGLLLFVDSDIVVPSGAVEAIRTTMDDPQLAAAFGSYDDGAADPRFLSQYRNLLHHYTHQQNGGEATTFWAGFGIVRSSVFLEVGGFLEDYGRPCVEDIELGMRIASSECQIRLCPEIQVKHLKRWRFWNMVKTDILDRTVPWSRLILERGVMADSLNTSRAARLSALCVFAVLGFGLAGLFFPTMWAGGFVFFLLLVLINHGFFRFLARVSGWFFALACIPLYGFYLFYSCVSFAAVMTSHYLINLWRWTRSLSKFRVT